MEFSKLKTCLLKGQIAEALAGLDEAESNGPAFSPKELGELLLAATSSSTNNLTAVRRLIVMGANDFAVRDQFGNTVVTLAACNLNYDLVALYLEQGVLATDKDGDGDSVFSIAVKLSNDKLLELATEHTNKLPSI